MRPRARQRLYLRFLTSRCIRVHTIGMPVVLLIGEAPGAAEERSQRGFGCGADADGVHLIWT